MPMRRSSGSEPTDGTEPPTDPLLRLMAGRSGRLGCARPWPPSRASAAAARRQLAHGRVAAARALRAALWRANRRQGPRLCEPSRGARDGARAAWCGRGGAPRLRVGSLGSYPIAPDFTPVTRHGQSESGTVFGRERREYARVEEKDQDERTAKTRRNTQRNQTINTWMDPAPHLTEGPGG